MTEEEEAVRALNDAVELLRGDINQLEGKFDRWEVAADGTSGSREVRSIAGRIVGSAQRLKALVQENSYSY